MKTPIILIGILVASITWTSAQGVFDSGSDGSDGELFVNKDTVLNLPPDGIFRFTTVTITNNARLRFVANDLNTPVHMLATGDINLSGSIDINGQNGTTGVPGTGGPGGFRGGGKGFDADLPPGSGFGPGAGEGKKDSTNSSLLDYAGSAGFGTNPTNGSENNGARYGNSLLLPVIGGSGGGGDFNYGGGGGGGALLLASNTKIAFFSGGNIYANGGSGSSGGGERWRDSIGCS